MSMIRGQVPIKVVAAQFITADNCAVQGVLFVPGSGASAFALQDASNHDICSGNAAANASPVPIFFPETIPVTGLSVTVLSGTGAILYVYLVDV